MTRDQVRSLLLGYAVAGRLVAEPEAVLTRARRNLGRLKSATGGGSNPWLGQWERLLDGPLIDVLRALTSDSPASRELRQNSPFAGVLSQVERSKVLAHVTRDDPVAV